MFPPEFEQVLSRIKSRTHTPADIETLRQALLEGRITIATGERAVALGGSADGAVIVTGDVSINIDEATLQAVFRAVRQELVKVTSSSFSEAESSYRRQVVAKYNYLDFSGFEKPDLRLDYIPLEQVFVRLSLTVEKVVRTALEPQPDHEKQKHGGEANVTTHSSGATGSNKRDTDSHSTVKGQSAKGQMEEKTRTEYVNVPISLSQVLAKNTIIIGGPGTGKSTLLRWLAVTFAQGRQWEPERLGPEADVDRLPVYVELGKLPDEYLQGEGGNEPKWTELLPHLISRQEGFDEQAAAVVQRSLSDGRCLVLCDGLDEVVDQTARRRIAASLREFGRLCSGNRVIVSGRPAGLVEVDSAFASFQRCRIKPFSPEQVQAFFRFWYSLDPSLSPEEQIAGADNLFHEVQNRPTVAELATTPLLATIILLIWRNEGQLPEQRVELYEKCCKILIENWEAHHQVKRGKWGKLSWMEHLRLLAPLAYRIHSQEQRTGVSRSTLIPILATVLLEESFCAEEDARQEASSFLEVAGLRSGLLQRLGGDEYGFPHLVFQEYLAAHYIATRPYPDCIDLFMEHLNKSWWQEVHVLTIGCLSFGIGKKEENEKETGEQHKLSLLLRTILQLYPPPSPFLQPDPASSVLIVLLMALFPLGRWLPQLQVARRVAWLLGRELELVARGILETNPDKIGPDVRELFDTLAWRFTSNYLSRESLIIHPQPRRETLAVLAKASLFVRENLMKIVEAPESHADRDVYEAAEILLSVGQVTRVAVERRIIALAGADSQERLRSAMALMDELDLQHPIVVETLVDTLNAPHAEDVYEEAFLRHKRYWAATLLGRTGRAGEAAIPALCAAVRDEDPSSRICLRKEAIVSLGQLGCATPEVIDTLVWACDQGYPDAAFALIALGVVTPSSSIEDKVIGALSRAARSEAFASQCALSSTKIPRLIPPLIDLLGCFAWQNQAAEALARRAQADLSVGLALAEALVKHPDPSVKMRAAGILLDLGQTSSEILSALVKMLRKEVGLNWSWDFDREMQELQIRIAETLGKLGQATPKVIGVLVYRLDNWYPDGGLYNACAVSLGRLARISSEAVRQLLKAWQNDVRVWRMYAGKVAVILNTIEGISPQPVCGLVDAFDDNDEELREFAAQVLGELLRINPTGLPPAIQALQSGSEFRRFYAARAIGLSNIQDPLAIQALLQVVNDPNQSTLVREVAAESLGRLGQRLPQVVKVLQSFLDDADWRIRSNAAGLLVLWQSADSLVIETLLKQLQLDDPDARRRAAHILGDLDEARPEVLSALLGALTDEQALVRRAAATSLGQLGVASTEVIHALETMLDDPEKYVRCDAVVVLGRLKPILPESTRALLKALLKALNDTDDGVRYAAVVGLAERLDVDPQVEETLRKALWDESPVWIGAMEGLAKAPTVSPQTIGALVKALGDDDRFRGAAETLRALGNRMPTIAEAIAEALLEGTELRSHDSRLKGVQLLGDIGNPAPKVIEALLQACRDEDEVVRNCALGSLGRLGYTDGKVFKTLGRLLGDERVRYTLVSNLHSFNPVGAEFIKPLLEAFHSSHKSTAWECLDEIKVVKDEAKPLLLNALRSRYSSVREAAARLLSRLETKSSDIIESLIAALADNEEYVRNVASKGLDELCQVCPQIAEQRLARAQHDLHRACCKARILTWLKWNSQTWEFRMNLEAREGLFLTLLRKAQSCNPMFAERLISELGARTGASIATNGTIEKVLALLFNYEVDQPPPEWERLQSLQPGSTAVKEALLKALDHRSPLVRSAVALALYRSEKDTDPRVSHELAKALSSPLDPIRLAVAVTIGRSDHIPTSEIVKALSQALNDERRKEVRYHLAIALARAGEANGLVVENLLSRKAWDRENRTSWEQILDNLKKAYPNESDLIRVLPLLFRHFRHLELWGIELLKSWLEGRPLPGYRWVSVKERQARSYRLKRVIFWVGITALMLIIAAIGSWLMGVIPEPLDKSLAVLSALVAFGAGIAQILGRRLNDPWDTRLRANTRKQSPM